jgi:hypothetical protein
VRAWRLDVENEPKPGHDTLSPFDAESTTRSTNAWMTRSASADETLVFAATAARRSAFVIAIALLSRNRSSVNINLTGYAPKMQAPPQVVRRERVAGEGKNTSVQKCDPIKHRFANLSTFFDSQQRLAPPSPSCDRWLPARIVNKSGVIFDFLALSKRSRVFP